MSTRVQIQGDNRLAAVCPTGVKDAASGLVVLSTPLVPLQPRPTGLVNDEFGREMNQNIAFSGTPVRIHDGVDSVLWTATNIVGSTMTANSAVQAQAGSTSVEVDNPAVNDVWEFNSGSTQDLSGYAAFSMYIYVDKDWTTDSIEMFGWDGAAQQGVSVRLEDYFDQTTFDVWQFVSVPKGDMALSTSTIESLRMTCAAKTGGKSPKFYIDELLLQEVGAEAEFTVASPSLSEDFYVSRLYLSFADNVAGTVTGGTMLGLDYTAFLGVSALASGIVYEHVENGASITTEIYKGLGDMCEVGWRVDTAMSNGTNTFVTMARDFEQPIVLAGHPRSSNRVSIVIRDDMSGLLSMTGYALGAAPR